MAFVVLDGYKVHHAKTEKAVAVVRDDNSAAAAEALIWVPRSVLEDPEPETGETDISVQEWFAIREGLDY